jgi:hypothetical protein
VSDDDFDYDFFDEVLAPEEMPPKKTKAVVLYEELTEIEEFHRRKVQELEDLLGKEPETFMRPVDTDMGLALARPKISCAGIGEVIREENGSWSWMKTSASFKDGELSSEQDKHKSRNRYDLLRKLESPFELRGPHNVNSVDLMFSEIYERAPWCREVLTQLWRQMRQSVQDDPWFKMRPILLHGEPGCGKSFLAQIIADVTSLPFVRLNGAEMTSVFPLCGHDAGWSNSDIGTPMKLSIDNLCANPIILFDEIDKAQRPNSNGGDPQQAVLAMIDTTGRKTWFDPFLKRDMCLSEFNWIFTANDISKVNAPLIDRCQVFEIERPAGDDLRKFVANQAAGLSPSIVDVLCEKALGGQSLRSIDRAIQAARLVDQSICLN